MLSGTRMPEKCRPHSFWLPGIVFRTVKTLLSVIALTGFISSAFAAKDGWLDDIEKAKELAKQGGKRILLDFTGSDWCGWCKKLDAEVFSQQEFNRAIASNGEELEEVAMIPCGDFLFGAHAAFFGGVLAQEIEGKVA